MKEYFRQQKQSVEYIGGNSNNRQRRTREKQQMTYQIQSSNPLFRPVREFKKSLIAKAQVKSLHSDVSGTSIYQIHPEFRDKSTPNSISKLQARLRYTLSKQNILNINHYLEALEELFDNPDSYNEQQTKRIKELCYIGVGKGLVDQKKIALPSYSRVNLLIRQFMIDPIARDILDPLKEQNPSHIFIDANDKGLGFKTSVQSQNPQFFPIITKCNSIITQQFLKFKRKKQPKISPLVSMSSWINIIGVILMAISLKLSNLANYITMITGLVFVVLGVLFNFVYLIFIQQKVVHENINVIEQIQRKLQCYLAEINQKQQMKDMYQWICGKDFYWLQIVPIDQFYMLSNT